jgi:hypothetical protein
MFLCGSSVSPLLYLCCWCADGWYVYILSNLILVSVQVLSYAQLCKCCFEFIELSMPIYYYQ